jgi:alpha-beta hydrolase superfamily lysophospholipase
MLSRFLFLFLFLCIFSDCKAAEYDIPSSIRFTCDRQDTSSEIVYYFKKPVISTDNYPILILCEGSSLKGDLESVMFMFKYFEEQVAALDVGFITVEQWGIDGNTIDEETFFDHYSRTQRFNDHMQVIKHLENHPPNGWNGQLIFLGVSEGGPLVTALTTSCSRTLATVNWSGAGDWPWAEEVWAFFEDMRKKEGLPSEILNSIPSSKEEYNALVEQIKLNPSRTEWFAGMTYFYLADAFQQAPTKYDQIRSPFLIVQGTEDSTIESCDEFVRKAKEAGAPIEYIRVEGMDHYIRKRPDIIDQSFEWLKNQLDKQRTIGAQNAAVFRAG